MNKKYIPPILTILAIIIATFFWEKINLTYNPQNQIHGEYSIKNYNANTDVIRFVFFISFPLIIFLLSYIVFNTKNIFYFKEVIFKKGEKTILREKSGKYNFLFFIFIFFIFLEFFSIDFSKFGNNLDLFHEGTSLTPSNNSDLVNGFWSTSYAALGLFGNFGPFFFPSKR